MREKWDAETILSTKTNLENHPRTITAKESVFGGSNASFRPGSVVGGSGVGKAMLGSGLAPSMTSYTSQRPSASAFLNDEERLPKIRINPRTGFPEIVGYSKPRGKKNLDSVKENGNGTHEDDDEDDGRGPPSGSDSGSDTEEGEDYDSDATEGGKLARHMSTIAVTAKRDRNESKE